MSEEQQVYDEQPYNEQPLKFAHRHDETPRYPPVCVTVTCSNKRGRERLATLIEHVLGPTSSSSPTGDIGIVVQGFIDGPIEEFVDELEKMRARILELEHGLDVEQNAKEEAILELMKERRVTEVLESRLGTVASQRIALAVAHGDVPPEQFENRRKIEVEGVRNLVAALRVNPVRP